MTGVTPWNAVPLWQVAHPEVIPVWTIVAPENAVVLAWQVEQSCVAWIWFPAFATGITPWKLCPPWQVAQPELMPVWLILPPVKLVKLVWQVTQSPEVVKWVVPFATGVTP